MLNKKITLSIILIAFTSMVAVAQNPKKTIAVINAKFAKLQSYKADVGIKFDIPNVKMSNVDAKVFYKKPNKFKIKAPGLFFLPKQNPMQDVMNMLSDTTAYTAISTGKEIVNGKNCSIINIIPIKNMGDLILGKLWIDDGAALVMKSEITTKNNGTIQAENTFGTNAAYALPDAIKISMEVTKFKIPKMLAMDINKKKKQDANTNAKEKAFLYLTFKNYAINKTVEDSNFN